MLDRAVEVIDRIAAETDGVILMHSLSGKDSIALLDLLHPRFKRVYCVYMYLIPNMEHIMPYYRYAKRRYPGVEFVQVPHYGWYSYRKYGYMGMECDPKQREWRLSDIIDRVREMSGLDWCCLGFKQSDSLNRRLMLRSYKDGMEAISWRGRKFYPLSTYKNGDVLRYISENNLKTPENYGGVGQSCGCSVTSYYYLTYLRDNYPDDLRRVYSTFPATRLLIDKYRDEAEGRTPSVVCDVAEKGGDE